MGINFELDDLGIFDPELHKAYKNELNRQKYTIELIASENIVSENVLAIQGSILTNKYAEGYANNRYYGGCEFVDIIESLAIERAKKLFNTEHANVQPHSGSQANMAAFMALIKPGDKILGMGLDAGGHLTHGFRLSFSGINYTAYSYEVDPIRMVLDYDSIRKQALEVRPHLIIAGTSSYSRIIDYAKFREIADEVGAYLVTDIAHIAGLIATGLHPSPVPYADIITSTTHKTLRGPRGGLILCKKEFAAAVDKAVFPGIQGGPLMHVIAGKAVAFKEALEDDFKIYQQQVLTNARCMAKHLQSLGYPIISGDTETHLMVVDLRPSGNNGNEISKLCDRAQITLNKNTIPFDTASAMKTSGIRIGTPAITSRGMKEKECVQICEWLDTLIKNKNNNATLDDIKNNVVDLCKKFPIYS